MLLNASIQSLTRSLDININSTTDTLLASSCTSCQIQADKSAYWTPQFYFAHADGTFEEVFNEGMTIYYLGRGENGMQHADSYTRSRLTTKLQMETR